MNTMNRYLTHFITIVLVTHIAALSFFAIMWYFSGLEQALTNISGWHEIKGSEVLWHEFNLLHFLAMTYLPAMILAPIGCVVDWVNRPRREYKTATGKPLLDFKL